MRRFRGPNHRRIIGLLSAPRGLMASRIRSVGSRGHWLGFHAAILRAAGPPDITGSACVCEDVARLVLPHPFRGRAGSGGEFHILVTRPARALPHPRRNKPAMSMFPFIMEIGRKDLAMCTAALVSLATSVPAHVFLQKDVLAAAWDGF